VRYVAVSATIPNVHDIAQWLRAPAAGLLVFGEDMRPVRLVTHVRGYAQTSNDFLFERRLNDYLPGIVTEFSRGKPALIFCRRAPLHGAHCAAHLICMPAVLTSCCVPLTRRQGAPGHLHLGV
jgi:replicative superfamily II helicase